MSQERFTIRVGWSVANVFRESYLTGTPIRGVQWTGPAVVTQIAPVTVDGRCDELDVTLQPIVERKDQ